MLNGSYKRTLKLGAIIFLIGALTVVITDASDYSVVCDVETNDVDYSSNCEATLLLGGITACVGLMLIVIAVIMYEQSDERDGDD